MNDKSQIMRTHPFSILTYLYRFLFLLIIPLLRGFISAITGGLIAWLHGAWFDIAIVLLILLLAYQKWACIKYHLDETGIYYTSGILFKRQILLPAYKISCLSMVQPFWLRPFHIAKIRLDTIARSRNTADIVLYLKESEAKRILSLRTQPSVRRSGLLCEYRPPMLSVVFLSLFTSNSFIGILLIATFVSQAGQILGKELSDLLILTFEQLSRQMAFGIPPIAAAAAMILLFGWVVAFALNLLQTKGLETRRTEQTLHIKGGVITQKEYSLYMDDISFVDVRQSLLTRLLRLYSVFVNAIGLGKEKSDIAAIVPFSTQQRALSQLTLLLPEYKDSQRQLKPNAGAIFKFILEPLWPCLLIPAAALAAPWFLPDWKAIIEFAGLMLALPAYWFMGVRLVDFFSSGISRNENFITLRYSKWYYLHTVILSYDKIALINIRQSILQRGDGKCDVKISSRAEGRCIHHIRNLDREACLELLDAQDL